MTDEQLKKCFKALGRLVVAAALIEPGLASLQKQQGLDELSKAYNTRIDNILKETT